MTLALVTILLALALIGAPLFVLVGTATFICFLFTKELASVQQMEIVVQKMEDLLTKREFLAIPLFMASGAIMAKGGMATRLVNVAKAALGFLPGGIAIASVAACMFFASISGSSPVTLIAVGSIMVPAMVGSKYPENFALGLVTTAGSLGCLVPPSISMLIYAISVTGASGQVKPQDLFLAGLMPALFISVLLGGYSFWVGLRVGGTREKFDWRKLRAAVGDGVWALMLPFLVLGGIYGGLFNAYQAGAVAGAYSLIVTMVVYRELSLSKLFATLKESATLMGSLILIVVLAFGLNEFLAQVKIQDRLLGLIDDLGLRHRPALFLLIVNFVLIVIGALMDSISCTLIFAPILAPVAAELGIDPLHFGVIFVVNMEIGYLMPPVATNLFVASAVFRKPFGQVTRAVLPTLTLTCAALVTVMYVPTISKALVNWRDGQRMVQAFRWEGAKSPKLDVGNPDVMPSVSGTSKPVRDAINAKFSQILEEGDVPDAGP